MNVKENKYPSFWKTIHRDFKDKNINYDLICPMNYLYNLKLDQFRSNQSTIPVEYFFQKFKLEKNRKTCKKVDAAVAANDKEAAQAALPVAIAEISKAASKGIFHKNTAARKVSRITKAVNSL